jgi:hypothetical protein
MAHALTSRYLGQAYRSVCVRGVSPQPIVATLVIPFYHGYSAGISITLVMSQRGLPSHLQYQSACMSTFVLT